MMSGLSTRGVMRVASVIRGLALLPATSSRDLMSVNSRLTFQSGPLHTSTSFFVTVAKLNKLLRFQNFISISLLFFPTTQDV